MRSNNYFVNIMFRLKRYAANVCNVLLVNPFLDILNGSASGRLIRANYR